MIGAGFELQLKQLQMFSSKLTFPYWEINSLSFKFG